jgi:hypothetical protein
LLKEQALSNPSHDTEKGVETRARIRGRNGGTLTPFRPGDRSMTGYHKPANLAETLALARKASPAAMRTLIQNLNHEDGRISTMSANLILERAWGKPREMSPEERQQPHIDVSQLSQTELDILLRLVLSGRLTGEVESEGAATMIEAKIGKAGDP